MLGLLLPTLAGAGATLRWLQRHALLTSSRAQQRLRFIERYRSFVTSDTVGEGLQIPSCRRRS